MNNEYVVVKPNVGLSWMDKELDEVDRLRREIEILLWKCACEVDIGDFTRAKEVAKDAMKINKQMSHIMHEMSVRLTADASYKPAA